VQRRHRVRARFQPPRPCSRRRCDS
jgi:hypothetical protein